MSLMEKNYVTIPMSHSWERITSFAWVSHAVELRAFIARKMPKSMHNMRPYTEKELHHLPQKDIPHLPPIDFTIEPIHFEPPRSGRLSTPGFTKFTQLHVVTS